MKVSRETLKVIILRSKCDVQVAVACSSAFIVEAAHTKKFFFTHFLSLFVFLSFSLFHFLSFSLSHALFYQPSRFLSLQLNSPLFLLFCISTQTIFLSCISISIIFYFFPIWLLSFSLSLTLCILSQSYFKSCPALSISSSSSSLRYVSLFPFLLSLALILESEVNKLYCLWPLSPKVCLERIYKLISCYCIVALK